MAIINYILIIICALKLASGEIKFPSYINRCSYSDPDLDGCAFRNAKDAIKTIIAEGDPDYDIPKFEPLLIDSVKLGSGGRVVGFTLELKDLVVTGMKNAELKSLKNRFESKGKGTSKGSLYVPEFNIRSDYVAIGKVLLLPVSGNGKASLNITGMHIDYETVFESEIRDGEEYFKSSTPKTKVKVDGLKMNLENIFRGNKAISDNTNKIINENWKELFKDIEPILEKVVTDVMLTIQNGYLRIPVRNFFV